jgi:hypothetical protein
MCRQGSGLVLATLCYYHVTRCHIAGDNVMIIFFFLLCLPPIVLDWTYVVVRRIRECKPSFLRNTVFLFLRMSQTVLNVLIACLLCCQATVTQPSVMVTKVGPSVPTLRSADI